MDQSTAFLKKKRTYLNDLNFWVLVVFFFPYSSLFTIPSKIKYSVKLRKKKSVHRCLFLWHPCYVCLDFTLKTLVVDLWHTIHLSFLCQCRRMPLWPWWGSGWWSCLATWAGSSTETSSLVWIQTAKQFFLLFSSCTAKCLFFCYCSKQSVLL